MSCILELCATSRVQHAKVIFRNARGLASDSRDSPVTAAGRPGFSQASVREKRCSSSRLSVTPLYLLRHVERVFCVSFTRAKLMRLRAVQPPRSLSSVSFPPGEYSYLGTTLRRVSIEPMPSLLDVRQLIALYGILPLGNDSTSPVMLLLEAGTPCLVTWVASSWLNSSY